MGVLPPTPTPKNAATARFNGPVGIQKARGRTCKGICTGVLIPHVHLPTGPVRQGQPICVAELQLIDSPSHIEQYQRFAAVLCEFCTSLRRFPIEETTTFSLYMGGFA